MDCFRSFRAFPSCPFDVSKTPRRLPEDHLDFAVVSRTGVIEYIDLVEVAPLSADLGFVADMTTEVEGVYARLKKSRSARTLGDYVLGLVRAKAKRYDPSLRKHILVYNTDSRLSLDMVTQRYLRVRLAEDCFGLCSVYYFDGRGAYALFPDPQSVDWHEMLDDKIDLVMTHIELPDAQIVQADGMTDVFKGMGFQSPERPEQPD